MAGLQGVDQHRRARRAIALAEQIFGRVPSPVFGQEPHDELAEGVGVRIDAVEGLFLVRAGDAAEAGARRVDEHQVGGVEQAVGVADQPIGGGRSVAVVGRHHPLGPERPHVQPHRRGARAAIVEKGDRPPRRRDAGLEIGDVEHRRLGLGVLLAVFRILQGGAGLGVALLGRGGVVPALGVDHDGPGHRAVVDPLAFHRDLAAAGNRFRGEDHPPVRRRRGPRRRLLALDQRRLAGRGLLRRSRPGRQAKGGEQQRSLHGKALSSAEGRRPERP